MFHPRRTTAATEKWLSRGVTLLTLTLGGTSVTFQGALHCCQEVYQKLSSVLRLNCNNKCFKKSILVY